MRRSFSCLLLLERLRLDAAGGGVPRHRAGARLRGRGHGALPLRGDDAGHQSRSAAGRGSPAISTGGGSGGCSSWCSFFSCSAPIASDWRGWALRCAELRITATPRSSGCCFYTVYAYPFEIAAVVLLVAIIAAISLTMRRRPGIKAQNPAEQVAGASFGPRASGQDALGRQAVGRERPVLSLPHFRTRSHPVLPERGRDLSESKERHHPAHGHRAPAAVGQHELHRLLPFPR